MALAPEMEEALRMARERLREAESYTDGKLSRWIGEARIRVDDVLARLDEDPDRAK